MRYFKRIDTQGKTTTVESYSHNKAVKGAIAISKAEFDAFIASLPIIEPEPKRDILAEFDHLKGWAKGKGYAPIKS